MGGGCLESLRALCPWKPDGLTQTPASIPASSQPPGSSAPAGIMRALAARLLKPRVTWLRRKAAVYWQLERRQGCGWLRKPLPRSPNTPSRCPRGQLPPLPALHSHTGRPARRSRNRRGRPAGRCMQSAPRRGRAGPGGSPQEPLGHTLSTRGRMFPRKGVVGLSTPNSRRPPGVTTPRCPRATRDAVS